MVQYSLARTMVYVAKYTLMMSDLASKLISENEIRFVLMILSASFSRNAMRMWFFVEYLENLVTRHVPSKRVGSQTSVNVFVQ